MQPTHLCQLALFVASALGSGCAGPEPPSDPSAATHPAEISSPADELAPWLERARREGRAVSIAGAGYSMGGHSFYPGGLALDLSDRRGMELAPGGRTLRVEAGARWSDVLAYLDPRGLSVEIMQSFSDFSIGGSLSVNCHGWQPGRPPVSASVESMRVLTAAGEVIDCSRIENTDLFCAVLGGYGLYGIILDATLTVVPNELYRVSSRPVPSAAMASAFAALDADESAGLAYGRLSVAPPNLPVLGPPVQHASRARALA